MPLLLRRTLSFKLKRLNTQKHNSQKQKLGKINITIKNHLIDLNRKIIIEVII